METNFDTIYDLCTYYYQNMAPGDALAVNATVHDIPLSFHFYRLPNNFVFDSANTVYETFSLCRIVDTATQVLLGFNITVNQGVTLTPPYRCKGLVIFDTNLLTNNGTISMTSRGCIAEGQDIYLYYNVMNQDYEYVPAVGAAGAPAYSLNSNNTASHGKNGSNGIKRQTGGGGNGGARRWNHYVYIGRGGNGTSYSGGAGAGAGNSDGSGGSNVSVAQGSDTGGAGSKGLVRASNSSGYSVVSTGGQGNPNGGWESYRGSVSSVYTDVYGTGGLLIIYCTNLFNYGKIQSNGGNTMYANASVSNISTGGASGGGSVNIFSTYEIVEGTITASGGRRYGGGTYQGGFGGDGCVTIMHLITAEIRKNSNFYKNAAPQETFDFNKLLEVCKDAGRTR